MKVLYAIAGIFVVGMTVLMAGRLNQLWQDRRELQGDMAQIGERRLQVQEQRSDIEHDIEYLSRPENMEKEVKSRFTYRRADEQMLVVVPRPATSTSAPTP